MTISVCESMAGATFATKRPSQSMAGATFARIARHGAATKVWQVLHLQAFPYTEATLPPQNRPKCVPGGSLDRLGAPPRPFVAPLEGSRRPLGGPSGPPGDGSGATLGPHRPTRNPKDPPGTPAGHPRDPVACQNWPFRVCESMAGATFATKRPYQSMAGATFARIAHHGAQRWKRFWHPAQLTGACQDTIGSEIAGVTTSLAPQGQHLTLEFPWEPHSFLQAQACRHCQAHACLHSLKNVCATPVERDWT